MLEVFQRRHHFGNVVPVDGAHVLELQAFEEKPRRYESDKRIAQLARQEFEVLSPRQVGK